jgi:hypothetical protein
VVSTGHLWVQFLIGPDGSWKIDHLDFECKGHEEFISRAKIAVEPPTPSTKKKQQNKTTVPNSVINEWGVPPRVYHLLQVRTREKEREREWYQLWFNNRVNNIRFRISHRV